MVPIIAYNTTDDLELIFIYLLQTEEVNLVANRSLHYPGWPSAGVHQ
jgi:hypothetical protein